MLTCSFGSKIAAQAVPVKEDFLISGRVLSLREFLDAEVILSIIGGFNGNS